ncbi:MAG: hypothetical protein K2L11_01160, partial [Muribaculaceae bacterium]|nr:hypothetical protein [Muribaculaceae bacterium]
MNKIFTAIGVVSAVSFCMQAAPTDYMRQIKMGAPQVSNEIIEDAPAGELSWLDRSCDGFNFKAFMATHSEVLGSIVQRVDGEDGYVYLSHMASEYPVNTWTRFEKVGDTLVMEGIQAIYEEYDDYYDEYFTVYLAPMEVKLDENNVGTFVVNDDCRYVLNVGEDGSLTSADPKMLLGVCVITNNESLEGNDIWIWKGFGDRDIKMVPAKGQPLTLPEGLEVQNWVMKDEYVNTFVKVAIDGNDFYVNGLDQSLPDAWVKGALADGKVTFPSGQYLGADMDIYYYSYFCGAEFSDATDEEGETYRTCTYADSSVFAYDAEACMLTSENGYIINSTPDKLYPLYFYEDVTVGLQHRNPEAAPEAPYDLEFFDDDWGSRVWFMLPNTDVDGNILMVDKLYYEIYANGELLSFDIYDSDDQLVKTSRIPYTYDDWNDFWVEGIDHTVYLY